MTNEKVKRMFDAFYQAKRIREMLPALPKGIMPSYFNIWMSFIPFQNRVFR